MNQELLPFDESDGGTYEVDGTRARWETRVDGIIKLRVDRQSYEVTHEGAGKAGNSRFYIGAFRQPDGKLLQGRSLVEIIKKLVRFEGRLVAVERSQRYTLSEIAALKERVRTLEEKEACERAARTVAEAKLADAMEALDGEIDPHHAKHPAAKAAHRSKKLARVPASIDWEICRYIPSRATASFSMVPLELTRHADCFSHAEYKVLCAILNVAATDGTFVGSKHIAKAAGMDDSDVRAMRPSLKNRGFIRETGKLVPVGPRNVPAPEFEVLWHPWFGKGGEFSRKVVYTSGCFQPNANPGEKCTQPRGQMTQPGGQMHSQPGGQAALYSSRTLSSQNSPSELPTHDDEQEDLTRAELQKLTTRELESIARPVLKSGMEAERRSWLKRSEAKGWPATEDKWRLNLMNLVLRNQTATSATTAKQTVAGQPPEHWAEFVRRWFPQNTDTPQQSYANASVYHPDVMRQFDEFVSQFGTSQPISSVPRGSRNHGTANAEAVSEYRAG